MCTFRAPKEDGHTYKKSNKLARDSTEPRYRRHLVRRGGLKEDAKKERAPWPVNCMNGGTNMRSYALQHRLTQYDLSGGVPLRYPEVRRMGENMCVCVGEGSEGDMGGAREYNSTPLLGSYGCSRGVEMIEGRM